MKQRSEDVTPFSFDLSTLVGRSVASLYSHLVTRPTGRALRLGIESQIGELGARCLSVLDFTQVVVLDYSCADEAVAKLIQRYQGSDGVTDVYFVARGLGEHHRDPIEEVLRRHRLAMVGEVAARRFALLGEVSTLERAVWDALERARLGGAAELAAVVDLPSTVVADALHALAKRRVVLRREAGYHALSALVAH